MLDQQNSSFTNILLEKFGNWENGKIILLHWWYLIQTLYRYDYAWFSSICILNVNALSNAVNFYTVNSKLKLNNIHCALILETATRWYQLSTLMRNRMKCKVHITFAFYRNVKQKYKGDVVYCIIYIRFISKHSLWLLKH